MTDTDLQNITQNPLKPVVNSGAPEILVFPTPYVTSVVVEKLKQELSSETE
jgi:hypothetical protein